MYIDNFFFPPCLFTVNEFHNREECCLVWMKSEKKLPEFWVTGWGRTKAKKGPEKGTEPQQKWEGAGRSGQMEKNNYSFNMFAYKTW